MIRGNFSTLLISNTRSFTFSLLPVQQAFASTHTLESGLDTRMMEIYFSFWGLLIIVETPEVLAMLSGRRVSLPLQGRGGEPVLGSGWVWVCHRHQGSWHLGEDLDTQSPWALEVMGKELPCTFHVLHWALHYCCFSHVWEQL